MANGQTLTQLARKGQAAPGTNGIFSDLGAPALNDKGQVVFSAKLTGTAQPGTDDQGIYLVESSGKLVEVVRSGVVVDGETLYIPRLVTGANPGGLGGLNDDGDVAFGAALNGNYAVFIWNEFLIGDIVKAGNGFQVSVNVPSGNTNYIQSTASLTQPFATVSGPIIARGMRVRTNVVVQPPAGSTGTSTGFYRLAR